MSGPAREEVARPPRREVRLGCWVELAGARQLAFTSDLSEGGLSLQLAVPAPPAGLSEGAQLPFRLLLPPLEEPLEGVGRVAWVDADDRDVRDRQVLGFGLELQGLAEGGRERLGAFLHGFRHTLVVVDEDAECAGLYRELSEGFHLFLCATPEEALRVLEREEVAVLLVAEQLEGGDCLSFFEQVSTLFPNAQARRVVACEYTAAGQLQLLVNQGNLFSFLRKPFSGRELHQVVRRAVDAYVLATENAALLRALERANARLQEENAYLRRRLTGEAGFEAVVGRSSELRRALQALGRVLKTDTTVHLCGETGSGKELFARALHAGGRRAGGPFVVQGCAGLGESLWQSTLFGYVRGAFTGAEREHAGVFQRASGGTLLLDEVAELSPQAQAGLLRVLQEGEVQPLGAAHPLPVDVRLVSTSRKELREEVRAGRLREDLYYRLVVVPIHLPPLRARRGDIPLLSVHFLDKHCERRGRMLRGFSVEAMHALERHGWPGNVRELENEIERVVVLASEEQQRVHLEHLSAHLRPAPTTAAPGAPAQGGLVVPASLPLDAAVEWLERRLVEDALEACGGNVTRAAARLGMERSRLAKLRGRLGR